MAAKQTKVTNTTNSYKEPDKSTIFTQIRIDEDTFLRGKILASVYDLSFNSFVIRAINEQIKQYEAQYGELPKPVKLEK